MRVKHVGAREESAVTAFYAQKEKDMLKDPFRMMNAHKVHNYVASNELFRLTDMEGVLRIMIPKAKVRICGISGKVFKEYNARQVIAIRNIIYNNGRSYELISRAMEHDASRCIYVAEVNMKEEELVCALSILGYTRITSKVTAFADIIGIFVLDKLKTGLLVDCNTDCPKTEVLSEQATLFRIKGIHIKGCLIRSLAKKLKDAPLSFASHYSKYNENNAWAALCLRGYGGLIDFVIKPSVMSRKWKKDNISKLEWKVEDTELMTRFPEVKEIINAIPGKKDRVRFMRLSANKGTLGRHTDKSDKDIGVALGDIVRLHIPLVTNPGVMFTLWNLEGGKCKYHMEQGKLWYLDIRKPHKAINTGKEDRVHLVIDVFIGEKLQGILLDSHKASTG